MSIANWQRSSSEWCDSHGGEIVAESCESEATFGCKDPRSKVKKFVRDLGWIHLDTGIRTSRRDMVKKGKYLKNSGGSSRYQQERHIES